jgi:hypothetical protein
MRMRMRMRQVRGMYGHTDRKKLKIMQRAAAFKETQRLGRGRITLRSIPLTAVSVFPAHGPHHQIWG